MKKEGRSTTTATAVAAGAEMRMTRGRGAAPSLRAAALGLALLLSCIASAGCLNVSYDQRAILIDGKRRFLQSGSIHYPRSTPEMWPELMRLSKEGGLDVIQTYVFWDRHEPTRGTYNFAGNYDLVRFVKEAAAAGLYVNLRIGPYVCAEWNFGLRSLHGSFDAITEFQDSKRSFVHLHY